jgi:uncharacterized RDD family membrane protein YckC
MEDSSSRRLWVAIAGMSVVLVAQIVAFAVIGYSASFDLFSPSSTCIRFPMVPFAQAFQREIFIPLCGMKATAKNLQTGRLVALRAINLDSGRTREIEIPDASVPMGLVANDQKLWCLTSNAIYEFDGTAVVQLHPKRALAAPISSPFLYEGKPSVIEGRADGSYWVVSLIDGDWQDIGRVVLPGPNRKWSVDEQTGQSVLVPRTAQDSLNPGPTWIHVCVASIDGQHHVLQVDQNRPSHPCFRIGIDFVQSDEGGPSSALVPQNAVADTTGWSLLDSQLASDFASCAAFDNELVVASDKTVWRRAKSTESDPSVTATAPFEPLGTIEGSEVAMISLVSVPNSDDVYVVVAPFVGDGQVFKLQEHGLTKMPYGYEGFGRPLERWMIRILNLVALVLCLGSLATVLFTAWATQRSVYSFGLQTVTLAPLLRRCLARGLDMLVILGPPLLVMYWTYGSSPIASIIDPTDSDESRDAFVWSFATGWVAITWLIIAVTSGLWGVSPGKWLFGLKVTQATLRPAGLHRALVRELLFWLDAPFFLTILPGVFCFHVTHNRQRIGDLIGGTIVVTSCNTEPTIG